MTAFNRFVDFDGRFDRADCPAEAGSDAGARVDSAGARAGSEGSEITGTAIGWG